MGALTGDFDAVLQLSGPTLNRLAATMHQNGFTNDALPSLPHIAYFRINGSGSPDGERGSVAAQIGTPLLELIDGATDRFWVEMGFRARYRADPGSAPLADVIHGTIRAMYRLDTVDKSCPGWSKIASDYLWLRLVQSSVTFDGSTHNDMAGLLQLEPPDQERVRQRIGQHLAKLLATQFQPNPHRVGSQFRRLITRSTQGSSGVAFPVAIGTDSPAGGDLASIRQLFLGGHDFAVGVSADYIVQMVQSMVDDIKGRKTNIAHRRSDPGGSLSIDYHIRIDSVTVEWLGAMPLQIPAGLIRIRGQAVGWASKLDRTGVYNFGSVHARDLGMTASIEQLLMLQFDVNRERLVVSAFGDPTVHISYGGPFSDEVIPAARGTAAQQVKTDITAKLGVAQAELDKFEIAGRKQALVDQLKTMDNAAAAKFDSASFNPNGIVLRGSIRLTHRYPPHAEFDKPKGGGHFDAIDSWIPGGRIDSFEWSWQWFGNPVQRPPGTSGSRSETNSFLLARGLASRNHFGLTQGVADPLPGLDGNGKVCLTIKGVHVHPVTGVMVPVQSVVECAQFGYEFRVPMEMAPYFRLRDPRVAEVGLMRCAAPEDSTDCPNTLVLYLPEELDDDLLAALLTGVNGCRRRYAGLLVLLLFPDGAEDAPGADLAGRIERLSADLSAPVLVADDVRNRWSDYLGFATATSWRLLSPTGVVAWAHDGHLDAPELTAVLDERLVPSWPAEPAHIRSRLRIGERIPFDLINGDCPPVPHNRPDTFGSRIGFLDDGQDLSSTLRTLRQDEQDNAELPWAAIVIDGVAEDRAQRLMHELGFDVPILADPDGAVTRKFGVRFTPSVATLNSAGQLITLVTGPFSDANTRGGSKG